MKRILLHITESFNVNTYGLFIALGMIVCLWFIQRHASFKTLDLDPYFAQLFVIGFLGALMGGRLLYYLEMDDITLDHIFALWEGGFSLLGSVIGFCVASSIYLKKHAIPFFPFFDLIALHAPLLQSLSRIGCFFAGCCYGKETDLWCSVTYTDIDSIAPLCLKLHPTQLYSAVTLLIIFLLQYFIVQKIFKKPGQMTGFYLMIMSAERFFIDYLRADSIMYENYMHFSVTQSISAAIFISGLLLFFWTSLRNNAN